MGSEDATARLSALTSELARVYDLWLAERDLADNLAEALRLVAVDSYMLPLGTDDAVDSALAAWQEARRG